MNPQLTIFIAEAFIRYGPGAARQLAQLFQNKALADWEKIFALAEKPYSAYVAPAAN